MNFIEMLNRLRCRTGIIDFYSLFVPAESTQPVRLLRVRERGSAAMTLETAAPDPGGIAALAGMLFLDPRTFSGYLGTPTQSSQDLWSLA